MFELRKQTEDLTKEVHDLREDVQKLKEENNMLIKKTSDCFDLSIRNEQYSRKSNLKIYGVKEIKGETCEEVVLSIFHEKLGITLKREEIDVAHRVASHDSTKARPILIRFMSFTSRSKVLRARSKLKGSGVVIHEDIIRQYVLLMNRLKKHERVKDVWFWNNKIHVAMNDGKTHHILYGDAMPFVA